MSVFKYFRRQGQWQGQRQGRHRFPRSCRLQMLVSVSGVGIILVFSTAYILFSAKNLQNISDSSFEQERFIKTIQEDLAAYQEPLLEYLSTR